MYCSTEERSQIAIIEREIRNAYSKQERVPEEITYIFENRWMYPVVREYFQKHGIEVVKHSETCWELKATPDTLKIAIDLDYIR